MSTALRDDDRIAKKLETCKHFTGTQQKTCRAGVAYEAVQLRHEPKPYLSRGRNYTTATSIPCLGGSHNLAGATCDKRELPTREEVEAAERELARELELWGEARRRINEVIKAGGANSGTIECPKCGKRLGYARATSNGHIWGRCETAGCLAWME